MNTDTSILLLIAEQHAAIVGLRTENEALRKTLADVEQEPEKDSSDSKSK